MTDENVQRAARIDTATLSDALDKLVIAGQCLGIKPLNPSFRLCERAFTLFYAPTGPSGKVGDFIDDVPENAVTVIDGGLLSKSAALSPSQPCATYFVVRKLSRPSLPPSDP